ncbi:response regulator [Fulvivirga sp. M361]|uniref:response regulator n=1 Tax=Fulvivirga sp. M361 TaxID=2594266 RepID=UPI00117BCEC9|nr:response regulator [Fulvivirga sp. M361]TRX60508.1 response regulator [Fulvivirga sp. M361]
MKKILLCDDDGDITTLMQIIISAMKISFSSSNRITDITGLVLMEKPDLILMDLWIPDIGGKEAVRELKANEQTTQIPVLLFSATDKLEEICAEVGADGCIKKPFDVKDFKLRVKEYL